MLVHVCVYEREWVREKVCVCLSVPSLQMIISATVAVCMCVLVQEREKERKGDKETV